MLQPTIFSSKQCHNYELDLYISNTKIKKVTSCKYLGVIVDEQLSWEDHIEHVFKKLIKFTSIFYKLRSILPKHCLHKLYYAFVYPHLLYSVEVYGNASKSALDKLCKLNNKILRILLHKKIDTPVYELYNSINSVPIPFLHEISILKFIHKCMYHKHLVPVIFHSYYNESSLLHEHFTRRCTDLHLSSVYTNFGKRTSTFHGSVIWNKLPSSVKSTISIPLFNQECLQFYQHL